jgi:hypothetical protein
MIHLMPTDGKGLRTWQCADCDAVDPLKSARAEGWAKSSLQPPV